MNCDKLKGLIVANGDTQSKLAKFLGISVSNLNAKINGNADFRRAEIELISKRYSISDYDIINIFFVKNNLIKTV